MNRLIVAAIGAVIVLYVLFSSIYVINEREQAIVTRFGRITEVHTEPGIYFKLPTSLVDNVQVIEDRLLRYDIANMRLQVSGGQFYIVDAFLTYRITDPRLFRERAQGDLRVAEQRLGTRFESALRQVYGLRNFTAALSEQRSQMMAEMSSLGVTSNAGFFTSMPAGASGTPRSCVTSSLARVSMGISLPLFNCTSKVERGAAT